MINLYNMGYFFYPDNLRAKLKPPAFFFFYPYTLLKLTSRTDYLAIIYIYTHTIILYKTKINFNCYEIVSKF